ncbi:unnamed protein product [Paramecium primaurelia]|uniref:Uncharacterized protein n=1 Tax=Paramecium primaurelia TaxID=5886 RepID=A0A8S1MRQ0_PARPR|nr:unnamed protein product [Paramecium primaurelia]
MGIWLMMLPIHSIKLFKIIMEIDIFNSNSFDKLPSSKLESQRVYLHSYRCQDH